MRLKNIKGADKLIEKSPYTINNAIDYRGKFKTLFSNNNPLHLEIGTGKGSFIINMAKKHKEINFLGIEKYDSVLLRAIQKIDEEIPNLRLIKYNAEKIEKLFNKEIDVLYLNFSDPWPKNRHEHRRLTSQIFLKRYEKIFNKKNIIIQKTDNRKLFEFSLENFVSFGYKIKELSLNMHNDERENIMTEYEERFSKMGYPIYMVKVEK